MAANTISLTFKVEELNDGLKRISADAEGLKRVMQANVKAAAEMRSTLANTASAS